MRSEHPNAASHNLRIHTDLRASHHVKPDTRRFAGIFPLGDPEAVFINCGDATHEEHSSDSGDSDPSGWEFVDKHTSTPPVTSVTSADEGSPLSAAQQIIACYRAGNSGDHAPGSAMTEIKEKELPQVPDDQRSMYTLATSTDTQSTIDMMWKPKPKVHMSRTDRRALILAQSQAIAMMNNAGLKPANKIQCRHRGCADILSSVESLKYHLHIHNIADKVSRCDDASPSGTRKPGLVECSTSNSKTSRSHSRSKSSPGTHYSCSMISPPRKLSAGVLPFSPRESSPEVQHVPSLTTVAAALVFGPSSSKSAGPPLPVCNNNETPSTRASVPLGGRKMTKESKASSAGTECASRIAMLLSPHSSPGIQGRPVLTLRTNPPILPELNPVMDDDRVSTANENAHSVSEKHTSSRSPMRALSPMRAMSPIRNGIRRALSIGHPVDSTEK